MQYKAISLAGCICLLFAHVQAQDVDKRPSFFKKWPPWLPRKVEKCTVGKKTSAELHWQRAAQAAPHACSPQQSYVFVKAPGPTVVGIGGGIDLYEEAEALSEKKALSHTKAHFSHSYEKLRADTSWLGPYQDISHSYLVNPYPKTWKDFDDTLEIELYDSLKALGWAPPLPETVVTSDFGMRRYRWHYGVDLRLSRGDSVQNAFYGVVRLSQYQRRGFGHYVLVHHYNGLETIYAHLSKRLVKRGEIVPAGHVIGLGGNTGRSSAAHLHFETRYKGMPIDPNQLFDFQANKPRARTQTLRPATFAYLKKATRIRLHRVRRGQTLSHISMYYGVSIARLCRLNGISRRSILRVGQKIRVK